MPHQKNVHAVKFFIRKNKLIFLLVDLPVFGDITRLHSGIAVGWDHLSTPT